MSVTYIPMSEKTGSIPVNTKVKTTSTADGEVQHVNLDGDLVETRIQTPTKTKALNVQIGPGDVISNIPVVIEYDHHQIHEGESHIYCYLVASLASGSNQDFRINVPAGLAPTTRTPHVIFEVISTLETEIYLYEDMTYNAGNGGTLQTSYNRNRNSANAAQMKIYLSPTAAATGTLIHVGLSGSGRAAGADGRSMTEFDLKPNSDYLLRITSRAASDKIVVRVLWYEDLGV